MASLPGDDQTDADFFDKLVDDDDDLGSAPAAAPVEGEAAMARGLSSLSLAGDEAEGSGAPKAAVAAPALATATAPAAESTEDGSPGSGKGVHTTIKQVQWSVFGGDGGSGADPFGEFGVGGGGEEAFFGSVMGNRSLESSVVGSIGAADHSLFGGTTGNQNSAREVTDQDFLEGSLNQKADAPLEENSGDAVSLTDPKYLERLYPGWKYDEVTQQWYQVDSFGVTGNATQVVNSSENAQQKQQQFDVSYLQNSAQVALETIAEEGSATVGSISSWAQDSSGSATEYPPNMLFYAEYPGWYFDTNTQQWNALESYQQAIAQAVTTTAIQDGASQGNGMGSNGFAGTDRSTEQAEDLAAHNQGAQQNSFANSYSQQSYWQPDMFGNDSQPDSLADNSLAGSFYSADQHVNAETFSTNHQIGFNTSEPSTGHYGGNECLESSGFQSGYGSFGGQQAGYMGFEPSTGLTSYKGFEPSTSHPAGYKGFEPSTGHQAGYKGFKPSKGRQAGFEPSTGQQAGYKGFEPSMGQQAGYKGFEPSTGNHANYKGFEPSTAHHAGYKAFDPSTGHQTGYKGFETSTSHGYGNVNAVAEPQGFLPTESIYQSQTHSNTSPQMPLSNSYFGGQNMSFPQQQASHLQYGYSPHEQRSSAGRPPHALIAFGFGGKLIVMKETSSITTNFNGGNQGNSSGTVSVLNLSDIVADKVDASDIASGSALSYFHALCRQPIPGPLVGGSAATKDVNKWLDEMITGYESSSSEFQRGDHKLLISLLKILCQHYGKFRSPFGSDPSQEDLDGPEMAVTKLFSSSKSSVHMTEFGSIVPCMKNLPSESQLQAIAQEVQSLLVSGRRKEALQRAQEGQLWGPAIILALQLGDKFYVDTVKKMAQCHFIFGSPLRTLCLLIAGQPGDVFNVENRAGSSYGTLSAHQQPMEPTSNGMLDDWEENLAIITANRTKGDDLVITHLGDCLWREKNKVAAAHSCYLVAELNIDAYSESARLCLIGADHLKHPRTFASPEAIQRTEVYEYAKVLGNSQYILLPFQPYKLIYAYMLVEVGKVSDSLRYCQASLKALKASGRTPELEAWKQLFLSLEERIRTHQQGGYGTNLAPAKLVGKLFTSLDKSISRMMGTPSAPLPPMPQGSVNDRDSYPAPAASKVVNSQSVMAMSSLVPSASVQSMSEMAGDSSSGRKIAHNRSVSEPDFGRTPKQGAGSDSAQSSASGLGSSRFGWFSSTLQRTMGLVSRSHRQAKLGEQNKFYYDEKLKRWVDPSAEAPAEEPPLAPPPTKPSFQNGLMDHNLNGPMSGSHTPNGFPELKSSNPAEQGLGMPPIPPSQNQFSARGRIGVRSRYVDTFNRGGAPGAMPSYNKPAAPSMQPPAGTKFFVPTAAVVSAESAESIPDQAVEAHSESAHQDQPSSSQPAETSFSSSPLPAALSSPAPSTIHRHPSMDNITPYSGSKASPGSINSSLSRTRAASWSGTYSERLPPNAGARSPEGQTMPSQFMPGNPSHNRSNSNSSVQFNGLTEDLHEVEL